MSAAKHTPGPLCRCVTVKGRDYTVHFNADGAAITVQSHVQRDGYTAAMRRLPLTGQTARAAIAKATGSSHGA